MAVLTGVVGIRLCGDVGLGGRLIGITRLRWLRVSVLYPPGLLVGDARLLPGVYRALACARFLLGRAEVGLLARRRDERPARLIGIAGLWRHLLFLLVSEPEVPLTAVRIALAGVERVVVVAVAAPGPAGRGILPLERIVVARRRPVLHHFALPPLSDSPSSRSCRSSTGAGAPVRGSAPDAVFGNAITSRIESAP
jgi:hypothetical protein